MSEPMKKPLDEEYLTGSLPEIFQRVELVAKKLKQLQGQTLKETRLSPPQFFILSLLWEKEGRPLKELAEMLACTRATVTGIVDTLEKKELVARTPNPEDRRSLLVRLSEKGRSLKYTTPTLEKTFKNCCSGLEPEEARELSRLLKKLDDSLYF